MGIYGTRRVKNLNLSNTKWRATSKENTRYYFYLNSGEINPIEVKLSDLCLNEDEIESIKILGYNDDIKIENKILKLPSINADASFALEVKLK